MRKIYFQLTLLILAALPVAISPFKLLAQAPIISYSSPQTYAVGAVITPLAPASHGVSAAGYGRAAIVDSGQFATLEGMATDVSGNIYVSDVAYRDVFKIPVGGGSPVIVGHGFNAPNGIAVDAAGNVYVADYAANTVYKIAAGGTTAVSFATGFNTPEGLAVDAAGNVYVADLGNNLVKKIPAGGGVPVVIGSGFSYPTDVAVDALGNVYVADEGTGTIKEIPAGSNSPVTFGNNYSGADGVAVDAAGNVYLSEFSAIMEIPAGGGSAVNIGSGFIAPTRLVVDITGNVFAVDQNNGGVIEAKPIGGYYLRAPLPAGLSFNNSTGIISGTPTAKTPAANYNITAYNAFGSSAATVNIKVTANADLAGLAISSGALSPAFATATTAYAASVANAVTSIALTPTTSDPGSKVKVNGTTVVSGTASQPISLAIGPNIITIAVTSADGTATKTYTLTVTRPKSNDAYLASLSVKTAALSPAFAFKTLSYTASVSGYTTSVTVTPALLDATATIKVNGVAVANKAASAAIPLAAGANTINIVVTAQDGVTTQTYTVVVTRNASSNAGLSALALNTGALSPVFATGTTSYTESVASSVSSVKLTATTADPTATITVNGTAVTSGTASGAITLGPGANALTVVVTAQDGVTKQTYTVTVGRGDNDAYLASLAVKTATLSPAFAFKTLNYTSSVPNSTSSVTVTPALLDATASLITINGTIVANKTASAPIVLTAGANNITIIVTAQDGVTTATYTITITRAVSTSAALAGLTLSNGTLSPAFAAATRNYTALVGNSVSSITLTPTAADPTATLTVNGDTVTSGTVSPAIALAVGSNTITIIVTAQDGVTTETYTLTVIRTDDSLADLTLNAGSLTPAFAPNTISYTASLAASATTIRITPTATDPMATITVNGAAVPSGTASAPITLNTGKNTVNIVVTGRDGVSKQTYTVIVGKGSNDAYLSSLAIKTAALSPVFAFKTFAYTSTVPNATSSVTVTPSLLDVTASSLTVNGMAVANKTASGPIALAVGSNTINIVAIAQDGVTTETYMVTITRAVSGADGYNPGVSVTKPTETPGLADDGIAVHQGVSPNGDGVNDFLVIDGILAYPDNKLMIMNRNGQLIYEAKSYDNSSKVFDGHSNKNGQMQLPGTYFYQLDYTANGIAKHKTGFLVLKY